jgi:predicted enzyme related to lactoylglutathione lyase
MLGRFVWYDLMTSDPEQGKRFYTELIGWGTEPWSGPTSYDMLTNQGTVFGGVMDLPEDARKGGVPPHWLAYIAVAAIEATVAEVTATGGNVLVPPTEIPNAGAFAVLQDPQGAAFAVYRSSEDSPPPGPPKTGQFSWHELATSDYEAAFAFYQQLFGWEKGEAMDMGEAGIYQLFHHAGMGGGVFNKPQEMPGPPFWLYYIKVNDIDHSVAKIKELGGQVLNGPMDVPGGDRVAQCMDSQGAAFALHASGAAD